MDVVSICSAEWNWLSVSVECHLWARTADTDPAWVLGGEKQEAGPTSVRETSASTVLKKTL